MRVSSPGDTEEVEAESFADAVTADAVDVPMPRRSAASTAKLLCTIWFETAIDNPTTTPPGVKEDATTGTFQIAYGFPTAPHFSWAADVMIHGNAGDPFADFQVGPLQVLRSWWFNVWWGPGANRTYLNGTVATPIRDALSGGNTWYADVLASANFGGYRDIRGTSLQDSPGVPSVPIANPIAGRVSPRVGSTTASPSSPTSARATPPPRGRPPSDTSFTSTGTSPFSATSTRPAPLAARCPRRWSRRRGSAAGPASIR